MNERRIHRLPRRAGKGNGLDSSGHGQGHGDGGAGSFDIVDLASRHRVEADRRERDLLAREERLRQLRAAQRRQQEGWQLSEAREVDEEHEEIGDVDNVSEAVPLFEIKERSQRVFSTSLREEIATINARRIRLVERAGRVLIVGMVLACAGILITFLARSGWRQTRAAAAASNPEEAVDLTLDVAGHLSNANRIAHRFMVAESIGERLQYVRHPGKVAELMLKDRSMDWDGALPVGRIQPFDQPFIDGRCFVGSYVEDENLRKYPIHVEIRADGYLVDWEAFAEYNEVPWEAMLEERSSLRDYSLRVVARSGDSYSNRFPEQDYTCFHIGNRDQTRGMHAYARKKSWVEKALQTTLSDQASEGDVHPGLRNFIQLKLRFPEGPTAEPMAEITYFVAPHWLAVAPDHGDGDTVNPLSIIGAGTVDVPDIVQEVDYEEMRRNADRPWRRR